jgi:hypothetical protein
VTAGTEKCISAQRFHFKVEIENKDEEKMKGEKGISDILCRSQLPILKFLQC